MTSHITTDNIRTYVIYDITDVHVIVTAIGVATIGTPEFRICEDSSEARLEPPIAACNARVLHHLVYSSSHQF